MQIIDQSTGSQSDFASCSFSSRKFENSSTSTRTFTFLSWSLIDSFANLTKNNVVHLQEHTWRKQIEQAELTYLTRALERSPFHYFSGISPGFSCQLLITIFKGKFRFFHGNDLSWENDLQTSSETVVQTLICIRWICFIIFSLPYCLILVIMKSNKVLRTYIHTYIRSTAKSVSRNGQKRRPAESQLAVSLKFTGKIPFGQPEDTVSFLRSCRNIDKPT